MDRKQVLIGISGGLCPPPFLEAIRDKILSTEAKNGSKPLVHSAFLDWKGVPKSAPKLIQEGDRKLRCFDEVEYLQSEGCNVVAIPNFAALQFLPELQEEFTIPIANIGTACALAIKDRPNIRLGYLGVKGIGKEKAITEAFKPVVDVQWIYLPKKLEPNIDKFHEIMSARKRTQQDAAKALKLLEECCRSLTENGADLILPTCGYQATSIDQLKLAGYDLLDVTEAYAQHLCNTHWEPLPKPFKVGLVGGLGPAATVDLYDKITRFTPAKNDQEHFKVVVEQNPQVPDRTVYLLHGGVDPTLALYSVCKKLEKDGVDAIIIPCNTAHAYFPTILPHLKAHLIDMQQVTLEEIKTKFGEKVTIGLLATDGTIQSEIYHGKAKTMGFSVVTPEPEFQKLVMESIYGKKGVKAGFTTGTCHDQLVKAAHHLAKDKGAKVLILGCTELPLILEETDSYDLKGHKVAIVDPTASLARRVVEVGQQITKIRGRR